MRELSARDERRLPAARRVSSLAAGRVRYSPDMPRRHSSVSFISDGRLAPPPPQPNSLPLPAILVDSGSRSPSPEGPRVLLPPTGTRTAREVRAGRQRRKLTPARSPPPRCFSLESPEKTRGDDRRRMSQVSMLEVAGEKAAQVTVSFFSSLRALISRGT